MYIMIQDWQTVKKHTKLIGASLSEPQCLCRTEPDLSVCPRTFTYRIEYCSNSHPQHQWNLPCTFCKPLFIFQKEKKKGMDQTSQKRESKLQRRRERERQRRANETAEQRESRLAKCRERDRARRQRKQLEASESQSQEHLQEDALHQQQRRANETRTFEQYTANPTNL